MLESAGFEHVEEVDQTPEFLVTTRAWPTAGSASERNLKMQRAKIRFEANAKLIQDCRPRPSRRGCFSVRSSFAVDPAPQKPVPN